MVHFALTLSLLAPQADVPGALELLPRQQLSVQAATAPAPELNEQLAGAGGVLLGQALAGLVLVGNERLLVRSGDLQHPAPTSLVLSAAVELAVVPILVAVCSSAVARGAPGEVFDALSRTFQARGAGAALLAALSAVAAMAQVPLLAAGGLLALFVSDYVTLPAAASLGLHAPDALAPGLIGPGSPALQPPPQASATLRLPLGG